MSLRTKRVHFKEQTTVDAADGARPDALTPEPVMVSAVV